MAVISYKPRIGKPIKFSSKMRASIHEAGHTAVYLALDVDVTWVKIYQNRFNEWIGETKPLHCNKNFADHETGDFDSLALKLTSLYAGYYAVYNILNYDNFQHALKDMEDIYIYSIEWFTDDLEMKNFFLANQMNSYKYVIENYREIKNLAKNLEHSLELNNKQIREIFYSI